MATSAVLLPLAASLAALVAAVAPLPAVGPGPTGAVPVAAPPVVAVAVAEEPTAPVGLHADPVPPAAAGGQVVHAPRADRTGPASGPPVRRFEAPPHAYGPGHRGVDLAAVPGEVLRAPAAGTVVFAGPVAGRGVVVVASGQGPQATRHALEPAEALVPVGTVVGAGDPVARLAASPRHAGCAVSCVHWGVRVAGRYVDPWWWLGLGAPVRLLPLDGLRAP
ncbi:M23 family metallopeptidase [Aquipuribacter sp. SD81]|uniref:M23 family metallopeptidase n=1 Tax=Aquipuribacter sp. SD81 TaxID=3127703 RepID=UPI00301726A3